MADGERSSTRTPGRRRDLVALGAGVFLSLVGVAGVVLGVVGDSVSTTTGSVVWLLVGVLVLVFGSRARRKTARP